MPPLQLVCWFGITFLKLFSEGLKAHWVYYVEPPCLKEEGHRGEDQVQLYVPTFVFRSVLFGSGLLLFFPPTRCSSTADLILPWRENPRN